MADEKSGWDKLSNVLQKLGGFLTAMAVALVGVVGSHTLAKNQERDSMLRAQAELLSQRETADTNLRKDMFRAIFEKYFQPEKASLDERILHLELLAYNFHDAIDLGPLFKDLYRKIDRQTDPDGKYIYRLTQLAKEVNTREAATLAQGGAPIRRVVVDFEEVTKHPEGLSLIDDEISMHGGGCEQGRQDDLSCRPRTFKVDVMNFASELRELNVHLMVSPPGQPQGKPEFDDYINVGFFDFPTIDNARLSNNQRCALIMTRYDPAGGAELTLLYFPGTRAALKDKEYVNELVTHMTDASSKQAGRR